MIVEPTDAVVRLAVTCVCGSDLRPYRGVGACDGPQPMGHEYAGIVEEVGSAVTPSSRRSAPRSFLPEPMRLIAERRIDPGRVFDLELPLGRAADAYRAMDERRAVKVLLRPWRERSDISHCLSTVRRPPMPSATTASRSRAELPRCCSRG